MKELTRVDNWLFSRYYEGINGNKKVICILDNFCVRYTVINLDKNGNQKSFKRHEFSDDKKELCFKHATEALNK